jgi:hypothetical protein
MAGKNWTQNMRRGGLVQRPRILTNNPQRASNSFRQLKPVGFAERGIRRLMKRDPVNAQGTPASDHLLSTPGMAGQGGSSASVKGAAETRQNRPHNSGVRGIVDRGRNTSLKKR